jgi:16S rRNA (guanine527-N7)-methyltransferase
LLAVKGAQAEQELLIHRTAILRAGGAEAHIVTCGEGVVSPPVRVISISYVGTSTGR